MLGARVLLRAALPALVVGCGGGSTQAGARSPNLTDSLTDTTRAGSCIRGWLQLPPKATVWSVEFAPYEGTSLSWQR